MSFFSARQNILVSSLICFLSCTAWMFGKINVAVAILFVMAWRGYDKPEFIVLLLGLLFWMGVTQHGNYLLNTICIIALVSVGVSYLQMVGIEWPYKFKAGYVFVGITPNINFHSALLAMSIPAFFRKKWKWFVPLMIYSLILCKSSGGVYALGAALIIVGLLYNKLWAWLGLAGIGTYLLIDTPGIIRFEQWKQIPLHLLGQGFGTYKTLGLWESAHNEYLQTLCELGLIFIIPIGIYLTSLTRNLKKISPQTAIAMLVIVFNSFVNPLFHIGQTAIMGLMWMAQYEKERHELDCC